jgi:amidase
MSFLPWQVGATELASWVSTGACSATEVIDAYLTRIAETNPMVNALGEVRMEVARREARELDARRLRGERLGPLAGVPFTVKASLDVEGSPTTFGIPALKEAYPAKDAPVVARLRRAGGIVIGRSNLPDLSLRFHTTSQLHGETKNPWDAAASPGGSSGGEGVALATGMSALGVGSDAGGSVRVPALFGGVAALKPSYGRFPSDRTVGPRDLTLASQWIPVEGLLARHVADLALAFRTVAGPTPVDPRVVPAPLDGPALQPPIRIAAVRECDECDIDPDVRGAVEIAAGILTTAGYTVEWVNPPRLRDAVHAHGRLIMTEFFQAWPMLKRILSPDSRLYLEYSMENCPPVALAEYIRLTSVCQGVRRDWATFMETYPLILAPTFSKASVPAGYDIAGPREHETIGRGLCLCAASNLVGIPSVAVPTGICNGLPLGVQLMGRMYREDTCLTAATIIENAVGTLCPIEPRRISP